MLDLGRHAGDCGCADRLSKTIRPERLVSLRITINQTHVLIWLVVILLLKGLETYEQRSNSMDTFGPRYVYMDHQLLENDVDLIVRSHILMKQAAMSSIPFLTVHILTTRKQQQTQSYTVDFQQCTFRSQANRNSSP